MFSDAGPLARVGAKRLRAAIAAGELSSRREGRRTLVLRSELEAWAPRPIHLSNAERHDEIRRAEDLYRSGHTIPEIARMFGRASTTIMAYLDEAGVGRTRGPRSRYPQPEPRECKSDDCSNIFTPEGWRVASGGGDFCSDACRVNWFVNTHSIDPVYPKPEPRRCGACDTVFVPPRANAARGYGNLQRLVRGFFEMA